MFFTPANDNVGLNSLFKHGFYGMLGRFCFQLLGSSEIRYQGEMNHQAIVPHFPSHLPHCLNVGQRFNITDSSTYFSNHNILFPFVTK